MSQSIIRRYNRTKSTNDEVDDNKVKYSKSRKYRTRQGTQLSYIHDEIELNKNEYTLTPSKYHDDDLIRNHSRDSIDKNIRKRNHSFFSLYPPSVSVRPAEKKRDGLNYTGKLLEVLLHHGQQQRTSMRESPLLNIGTEHFIQQSLTNECTVPFETCYTYDSIHSSTSRSRSNNSIIVPILNSPRTHLFTTSPICQSHNNGNFYLSTASDEHKFDISNRLY